MTGRVVDATSIAAALFTQSNDLNTCLISCRINDDRLDNWYDIHLFTAWSSCSDYWSWEKSCVAVQVFVVSFTAVLLIRSSAMQMFIQNASNPLVIHFSRVCSSIYLLVSSVCSRLSMTKAHTQHCQRRDAAQQTVWMQMFHWKEGGSEHCSSHCLAYSRTSSCSLMKRQLLLSMSLLVFPLMTRIFALHRNQSVNCECISIL